MKNFSHIERIRVVFRDMDALGHVNNAVYLTYLETARTNWFLEATGATSVADLPLILAEITVTFRSPAYMGEVLLVGHRVTEIRNSSFLLEAQIQEEKAGRLVATARAALVHYDYKAGRPAPLTPALRSLLEAAR